MATVNAEMSDQQSIAIGVDLFDKDRQPIDTLPTGVTIDFTSSDPAVAAVTVRADGVNADIASGKVGKATITVHANGISPPLPDETLDLNVTNSVPGSLNLRVGAPTDEPTP